MKLAAGWEVGPKTKPTLLDPAKAPKTGAVQLTRPSMKLAEDSEMTGVICLLSSGLQTKVMQTKGGWKQCSRSARRKTHKGHQNDGRDLFVVLGPANTGGWKQCSRSTTRITHKRHQSDSQRDGRGLCGPRACGRSIKYSLPWGTLMERDSERWQRQQGHRQPPQREW